MTQQNAPTKCPTCGSNHPVEKYCVKQNHWHRHAHKAIEGLCVWCPDDWHREPAAPPKSVQRHATETALDFKGEIEFLEDLENKRGIFAAPPEGETNGTRTHVQTNNGPIRTRTDSTLPDPQRGAIASPAMSAEQLAQLFHETYERLAPSLGYVTRKESAVPWAEVPEKNRILMIATCREVAAALTTEVEQLRVQLAGCSVAALGGTKEPAKSEDYGWSPAYQDVLDLRINYDKLEAELARLRAVKCQHEAYQGRCVHCDVLLINGRAALESTTPQGGQEGKP